MKGNHIIYIIGFMGSGKTTAGKKLASLLGWSFIDLDKNYGVGGLFRALFLAVKSKRFTALP